MILYFLAGAVLYAFPEAAAVFFSFLAVRVFQSFTRR